MVNGLLKNRESPSSRGPAGCKARSRDSKGDAMGPALHTREGKKADSHPAADSTLPADNYSLLWPQETSHVVGGSLQVEKTLFT